MRLFFAATPPPPLSAALCAVSQTLLPQSGGRQVPPRLIHLTLAFLGEMPSARVPVLNALAAPLPFVPFTLTLTRAGSFATRAGWLAPSQTPAELRQLVEQLTATLNDNGFHVEQRAYRAHLTVLRSLQQPLPAQALAEPLDWHVDHYALVASTLTPHGPRYKIMCRFGQLQDQDSDSGTAQPPLP
ncbi:MAG: RNA 2',3'-cyclic phosphodiesterase [Microvirgula sp.]